MSIEDGEGRKRIGEGRGREVEQGPPRTTMKVEGKVS